MDVNKVWSKENQGERKETCVLVCKTLKEGTVQWVLRNQLGAHHLLDPGASDSVGYSPTKRSKKGRKKMSFFPGYCSLLVQWDYISYNQSKESNKHVKLVTYQVAGNHTWSSIWFPINNISSLWRTTDSDRALHFSEVTETYLLELVTPRIQASPQTLCAHCGSTITSRWTTVRASPGS